MSLNKRSLTISTKHYLMWFFAGLFIVSGLLLVNGDEVYAVNPNDTFTFRVVDDDLEILRPRQRGNPDISFTRRDSDDPNSFFSGDPGGRLTYKIEIGIIDHESGEDLGYDYGLLYPSPARKSTTGWNLGDSVFIRINNGDIAENFFEDSGEEPEPISASERNIRDRGESDGGADTGPQCVNQGGFMGFLSCQILTWSLNVIKDIQNWIADVLFATEPLALGNPDDPVRQVWGNFRVIANMFLVIAFLVIIYSLATGRGD